MAVAALSARRPDARNPPSEIARRRSRRRPGSWPAACVGSGSTATAARRRCTSPAAAGRARPTAMQRERERHRQQRDAEAEACRLRDRLRVAEDESRPARHRSVRPARRDRSVHGRTRPVGDERRMMPSKRRQVGRGARQRPRRRGSAGDATATMCTGASSRATTPDVSAKPPPIAASKPSPTMSTWRLSKCQSGNTRG